MGNYISQLDSNFRIKAGNIDKAYKAIIGLSGCYQYLSELYKDKTTLEDVLLAWLWEACKDADSGDIDSIMFQGEKYGNNDILFDAIAPYVEDGSYIEMDGADGMFRFVFNKGEMKEVFPTIIWPE